MRAATFATVFAAAAVAGAHAQDSAAGVRLLVEVDPAGAITIAGDVQAPSHPGWIRGRALELGLGSLSDPGQPGAPPLVAPERVRLIKRPDVASAGLARAFAEGRTLARVTADVFLRSFDDPVPLRIVLENATVEDYRVDLKSAGGAGVPTESLAFAYQAITVRYTRYDAGGQVVDIGETGFDATYGTGDPTLDSDGDGIDNLADPDDDNDGMPDAYELATSLNPLYDDAGADPDGDGQDNGSEALSLTDPRDRASRFGILSITRDLATGELTVRVPTVPDRRYLLQASEGLAGWQTIDAFTTSPDDPARVAEFLVTPPAGRAFAQLRAVVAAAP